MRVFAIVLFVLTLTSSIPAQDRNNQDLRGQMEKALQQQEYETMIPLVRQYLRQNPQGFQDPLIQEWSRIRFQNIFYQEMLASESVESTFQDSTKPGFFKIARNVAGQFIGIPEPIQKIAGWVKRPSVPGISNIFQFFKSSATSPIRWAGDVIDAFRGKEDATPEDKAEWARKKFFWEPDEVVQDEIRSSAEIQADVDGEVTVVFAAGYINKFSPTLAFDESFAELEKLPFVKDVIRARSLALGSPEENIKFLTEALDQAEGPVVLMGYSKGGPDIMDFLAHLHETGDRKRLGKIVAVWGVATANGGSPIADDYLKAYLELMPFLPPTLRKTLDGLVDGMISLTTHERSAFYKNRELPDLPYFVLPASARRDEVPATQMEGKEKLDSIDPINDMQVLHPFTRFDVATPSAKARGAYSIDLGVVHAHHWDVAYPNVKLSTVKNQFLFSWKPALEMLIEEDVLGQTLDVLKEGADELLHSDSGLFIRRNAEERVDEWRDELGQNPEVAAAVLARDMTRFLGGLGISVLQGNTINKFPRSEMVRSYFLLMAEMGLLDENYPHSAAGTSPKNPGMIKVLQKVGR